MFEEILASKYEIASEASVRGKSHGRGMASVRETEAKSTYLDV